MCTWCISPSLHICGTNKNANVITRKEHEMEMLQKYRK